MRDLNERATRALVARMAREVAGRYREAGLFAFFFARGKLGGDTLFAALLAHGAIPDATRLVDLGCGQALLQGWLAVARTRFEESRDEEVVATAGAYDARDARDVRLRWPAHWPEPPRVRSYHGVDRSTLDLERARHALTPPDGVAAADLATIEADAIGTCDVVTLFDVLHYLEHAQQERLLGLVARCLAPGGTLLLRVGNIDARDAARRSQAVDSIVSALRGFPQRLHRRTLDGWLVLLDATGFDADVVDRMEAKNDGFANVLIRARSRAGSALPLK